MKTTLNKAILNITYCSFACITGYCIAADYPILTLILTLILFLIDVLLCRENSKLQPHDKPEN